MNFSLQQYQALEEFASITAGSLDVQTVYSELADIVNRVIPNGGMSLNLLTPSRTHFKTQIRTGEVAPGRSVGDSYKLANTFAEYVVLSRDPVTELWSDVDKLRDKWPGLVPQFELGYRSWVAVPVFSNDEVIGTLVLRKKEEVVFSEIESQFLKRIAVHVGGAVSKYSVIEELEAKQERSIILLELSKLLSEISGLKESIEGIGPLISKVLPVDRFIVSEFNIGSQKGRDLGIWGTAIPEWDSIEHKQVVNAHPPNSFSTENRALIIPTSTIISADETTEPGLYYGAKVKLVSMMISSLFVSGKLRGGVSVRSFIPDAYNQQDLLFFQEIAAQLNHYISAAEAREKELAAILKSEHMNLTQKIAAKSTEFEKISQLLRQSAEISERDRLGRRER